MMPPAGHLDLNDPAARALVLAGLNEHRGELNTLLNITFTEVEPGLLVATMPVDGARQPFGLLHGGASCVLAETLGSVAANLHAGGEKVSLGIDINATHHRAAKDGLVTGVCTPLHEGRGTATYQIQVRDEADRLLCTARITCQLRPRPARPLTVFNQPST